MASGPVVGASDSPIVPVSSLELRISRAHHAIHLALHILTILGGEPGLTGKPARFRRKPDIEPARVFGRNGHRLDASAHEPLEGNRAPLQVTVEIFEPKARIAGIDRRELVIEPVPL